MARKKYDEDVKEYTPKQLAAAKKIARDYYIQQEGVVSVKVLSRKAKVPQGYIREWMKQSDWSKGFKEDKEDKVQLSPETKKVLESSAEEFGLSEQEELFCYHYIKTFNATTSAIKAGYSSSYAHNKAYELLRDEKIKSFLSYIKGQRNQEIFVDSIRIIQEYIRIAFADMTDFVSFNGYTLKMKRSENVDGQLISKIKEGREGISIELVDKLAALEKLEKYLGVMPEDWKRAIEEQKLDIMKAKLELDKKKLEMGIPPDEPEDDGFMDALGSTAKEVWGDK